MEKQNNAIANNNYASMSDNELVMRARQKEDRAAEALFFRHWSHMIKAALYHFNHYPFLDKEDFMKKSPREKEQELQSEIYIAFNRAVRDYDFKSCAFSSHVNNKILWHFMDLYRKNKNALKVSLMSSYSVYDKDEEYSIEDRLQFEQAEEMRREEEFDREINELFDQIMRRIPLDDIEHRLLVALYNAFEQNHPRPIAHAAKVVNRSRQQAYNILKRIREKLPPSLASAFRDLF